MVYKQLSDRHIIAAEQNTNARDYWLNILSEDFHKSYLPYDTINFSDKRQMENERFLFSGDIFKNLMKLRNGYDSILHVVLVAAINVLMSKYVSKSDITIGTPIYKQRQDGEFINTILAIRNQFNGEMTFKNLLVQVKQSIDQANDLADKLLDIDSALALKINRARDDASGKREDKDKKHTME